MEQKIQITASGDTHEIIIREGKAREIKPKNTLQISGQIEAPSIYLAARKNQVIMDKSHLIVKRRDLSVILFANEDKEFGDVYEAIITGKAELNDDLEKLKINKGNLQTLKALSNMLKMNRFFFTDKDDNARIVSDLLAFKMKVEKTIEKSEDRRGNFAAAVNKTLDSGGLPNGFKLTMPIFVGMKRVTFLVEICIDERENTISCWLESSELNDLILEYRDRMIQQVVDDFKDFVIIEQ